MVLAEDEELDMNTVLCKTEGRGSHPAGVRPVIDQPWLAHNSRRAGSCIPFVMKVEAVADPASPPSDPNNEVIESANILLDLDGCDVVDAASGACIGNEFRERHPGRRGLIEHRHELSAAQAGLPSVAPVAMAGEVRWFAVDMLNSDLGVEKPASPAPRNGPFVCYLARNGESCWVELTTSPGRAREAIPAVHRLGGNRLWEHLPQYVKGEVTYRGPNGSFERATVNPNKLSGTAPPVLSGGGICLVALTVRRLGGFYKL